MHGRVDSVTSSLTPLEGPPTGRTRDGAAPGAVASSCALMTVPRSIPSATEISVANHRANMVGRPAEVMRVVGVTGTNGKTTTTFLLDAIFRGAGHVTGLIGSVEYRVGDMCGPATYTTPPAPRFQGLLDLMRRSGVTHVSTEVSSHALAEARVDGTSFDVGVFTNLTRDHLDFHGSMEAYAAAKRRLFEALLPTSTKAKPTAVVNVDDEEGRAIAGALPAGVELCSFSTRAGSKAAVFPRVLVEEPVGLRGTIVTPRGEITLSSPLIGAHNASNLLAAIGAAQAVGIDVDAIGRALQDARGAPGRLERVDSPTGIHAFVDYAHSPDALLRILRVGRRLARAGRGKLLVVFGCGGDRDSGKRPSMGRIAERLAHHVYVTSDNPRSEDPRAIADAILGGMRSTETVTLELDRAAAIRHAVTAAVPGDVILVAGKGHEGYQETGERVAFFDDREELVAALRERAGTTAPAPRDDSMVATSLRTIARTVSARSFDALPETSVSGLAFDLDAVRENCLFVLRADVGHAHEPATIARALEAGAAAVMISRGFAHYLGVVGSVDPRVPTLVVDDVTRALVQLSALRV